MTTTQVLSSEQQRRIMPKGNMNGWQDRHISAFITPNSVERPIVGMLQTMAAYADAHQARFASPLGDDYVLGAAWLEMLIGWRKLLNGELGRLDGGTLDRLYFEIGKAAGFDADELE